MVGREQFEEIFAKEGLDDQSLLDLFWKYRLPDATSQDTRRLAQVIRRTYPNVKTAEHLGSIDPEEFKQLFGKED